MAIELQTRFDSRLRIDVSQVCAQLAQAEDPHLVKTWQRLEVREGNRPVPMGQLFDIRENREHPDHVIIWSGHTATVDGVADGLKSGHWIIDGDAGNRIAAGIRGGVLLVHGSVGHNLGVNNRGGQITVNGNAGDYVAANLPGRTRGGNGACICINGSVGSAAARRMRRGTLAIGGSVGDGCGMEMLAGTLILNGPTKEIPGSEMRRGTLVLLGKTDGSPEQADFQRGRFLSEPTWPLIRKQIVSAGFTADLPPNDHRFRTYHAGGQHGGRGELWLAEPPV